MDFKFYYNYFSKDTIGRYDVTPIYSNPDIFHSLLSDYVELIGDLSFNKIVAIDASGFVLGSALAFKLSKSLVLARKEDKLPLLKEKIISSSFVDYSGKKKALELNRDLIDLGDQIIIVDDWVETGKQVYNVIAMVEELGAKIIGIVCIGADRNPNTEKLFREYNLKAIGVDV